MSWGEVDGAGWRWVHGLVIPMKKILFEKTDHTGIKKRANLGI